MRVSVCLSVCVCLHVCVSVCVWCVCMFVFYLCILCTYLSTHGDCCHGDCCHADHWTLVTTWSPSPQWSQGSSPLPSPVGESILLPRPSCNRSFGRDLSGPFVGGVLTDYLDFQTSAVVSIDAHTRCTHTHTHTHIYTHTCTRAHTHIYTHAHTHIYTHTHISTHVPVN